MCSVLVQIQRNETISEVICCRTSLSNSIWKCTFCSYISVNMTNMTIGVKIGSRTLHKSVAANLCFIRYLAFLKFKTKCCGTIFGIKNIYSCNYILIIAAFSIKFSNAFSMNKYIFTYRSQYFSCRKIVLSILNTAFVSFSVTSF